MFSAATTLRFNLKNTQLSSPTRLLHVGTTTGKCLRGGNSVNRYPGSVSTSWPSLHAEFSPERDMNFPIDPKSNPDDCAPYQDISGDYSRSGMRSAEYFCVDKKGEPYSPPGGEHRYGGTRQYEWSVEDIGGEAEDKEKKL